jgi:hypothetical protein
VLGGEIVHVFTHVRHFLTVETGAPTGDLTVVPPEGGGGEHEAYEWLSREELEGRGVTSAIKKILKAVDGGGGRRGRRRGKLSKDERFLSKIQWSRAKSLPLLLAPSSSSPRPRALRPRNGK